MGLTAAALQSTADDVKGSTDAFVDELQDLGRPDTAAGAEAQDTVDALAADLTRTSTTSRPRSRAPRHGRGDHAVTNTLTTMGNELTSTLTQLGQLDAQGEMERCVQAGGLLPGARELTTRLPCSRPGRLSLDSRVRRPWSRRVDLEGSTCPGWSPTGAPGLRRLVLGGARAAAMQDKGEFS